MTERDLWIPTQATVTSCRYQFRAASALAFGFQTGEKFRITFDYYAHGRLYSDQFQSPVAIPQNSSIPVAYNPLHPEQNDRSHNPIAAPPGKPSLLVVGLAGSIVLSVGWLLFLHSCR